MSRILDYEDSVPPRVQWNIVLQNILEKYEKTGNVDEFKAKIDFFANQLTHGSALMRNHVIKSAGCCFYEHPAIKEYAQSKFGELSDLKDYLRVKMSFEEFKAFLQGNDAAWGTITEAYEIREREGSNVHGFATLDGMLKSMFHEIRIFGAWSIYLNKEKSVLCLKFAEGQVEAKITTHEWYMENWWSNPTDQELDVFRAIEHPK